MIRKGLLLPDSQPVGLGINDARRGTADLGHSSVAVIYKKLPELELAAELFCAVLARELALPAPEPLLLFDPQSGEYLFGSVDLEYPNSLRKFNVDPTSPNAAAVEILFEAISTWSKAKEVAAFDEWIHNRDRNLGNLLYAGPDEFAIIDHGKALDVDPAYPSNNILCQILCSYCTDDRAQRALVRGLQRVAATFDLIHVEAPRSSVESGGIVSHTSAASAFYNLVEQRLITLATLIQNRLPGQHGLLLPGSST